MLRSIRSSAGVSEDSIVDGLFKRYATSCLLGLLFAVAIASEWAKVRSVVFFAGSWVYSGKMMSLLTTMINEG